MKCKIGVIGLLLGSLIAACSSDAQLIVTNVHETWESQSIGAFSGAGDVTWTGDTGVFEINSATWPVFPAQDFAGSRSLQHTDTVASISTIVTPFSFDPNRPTTWSVFASGNSADITSGRGLDYVLVADSSSISDIEGGTINGYRLRLAGNTTNTTDNLIFQKANGAGWVTLSEFSVGAGVNLRDGWNLQVFRETSGDFYVRNATGSVGTPAALLGSATDLSVLSGSHSGMTWFSSASSANAFGFDNFLITSIPEPSSAALLALGGLVLRRKRST